jgi:hypothetical protein
MGDEKITFAMCVTFGIILRDLLVDILRGRAKSYRCLICFLYPTRSTHSARVPFPAEPYPPRRGEFVVSGNVSHRQSRFNAPIRFRLPSMKGVMEVRSANTVVVKRGNEYLGM